MKKLTILFAAMLLIQFVDAQSLTKAERKSAVKYLQWSSKELYKSLKSLSTAQLNFHESDRWSPQECLYHIAFSEGALRGALDGALNAPADPSSRAELQATDDQIKAMITNRTTKVKTAPPFEPQNTGYKSYDEALSAYKAKRAMLIDFVKTTKSDLRNHVVTLPLGKMDAYQFVLFISGHTNRHTQQLNEVKMASGYPNG